MWPVLKWAMSRQMRKNWGQRHKVDHVIFGYTMGQPLYT